MRRWEQFVSMAALSVIVGGAVYAYNRERLADTDLNPEFQDINQKYFDGHLSEVRAEWGQLTDEFGETHKFQGGQFVIVLDRNENTSLDSVRKTLKHESCHVSVDWKEPEEHGAMFQRCMRRFD